MTGDSELVSTTDAAKELGVAPSTLRAWPGRYDFVKPACVTERGHYRWDLDELLRICDPRNPSARRS